MLLFQRKKMSIQANRTEQNLVLENHNVKWFHTNTTNMVSIVFCGLFINVKQKKKQIIQTQKLEIINLNLLY